MRFLCHMVDQYVCRPKWVRMRRGASNKPRKSVTASKLRFLSQRKSRILNYTQAEDMQADCFLQLFIVKNQNCLPYCNLICDTMQIQSLAHWIRCCGTEHLELREARVLMFVQLMCVCRGGCDRVLHVRTYVMDVDSNSQNGGGGRSTLLRRIKFLSLQS
jgi:hypothetical protein